MIWFLSSRLLLWQLKKRTGYIVFLQRTDAPPSPGFLRLKLFKSWHRCENNVSGRSFAIDYHAVMFGVSLWLRQIQCTSDVLLPITTLQSKEWFGTSLITIGRHLTGSVHLYSWQWQGSDVHCGMTYQDLSLEHSTELLHRIYRKDYCQGTR